MTVRIRKPIWNIRRPPTLVQNRDNIKVHVGILHPSRGCGLDRRRPMLRFTEKIAGVWA